MYDSPEMETNVTAEEFQEINICKSQRNSTRTFSSYSPAEREGEFCIDIGPGSSKKCSLGKNENTQERRTDIGLPLDELLESVSLHSIESFVCRICHNCENPEKLVSPCLCKGSLTYVHIYCLERWICTSRCTICELCQFQYNTQQTLKYSLFESLRIWYSRSMSRRALQEDCQIFSLLTLVAFGIIGTLLVAVQYYLLQGDVSSMARLWSKGWLIFFLFATLAVYLVNVYMIAKSHLTPWYRWWQSARDIRLILEIRKSFPGNQAEGPKQQGQQNEQQQSAAVDQQSSVQMPMGRSETKSTNDVHSANDTTCQNNIVQSWPQDIDSYQTNTSAPSKTVAITTAVGDAYTFITITTSNGSRTSQETLIFLPISSHSNCPADAAGSNVLVVAPYAADDNGCDDVVASPAKYSNKTAPLHSLTWDEGRRVADGCKDEVAAEANCKLVTSSTIATPSITSTYATAKEMLFRETATASTMALVNTAAALSYGVSLEKWPWHIRIRQMGDIGYQKVSESVCGLYE